MIVDKDHMLLMNERQVRLLKEGDFVLEARNTFIDSSTVKFGGKNHKVAEAEIQQLLAKGQVTITFQKGHLRRRLDTLIEENKDRYENRIQATESYYKELVGKKQEEIMCLIRQKNRMNRLQEEEKKPAALQNEGQNSGDSTSGKRCADQISGNIFLDINQLQLERKELKGGSYEESRKLFLKRGKWILPSGIPKSKFCEIADSVMLRLKLQDGDFLFDQPNHWATRTLVYPMHLLTINQKIREGYYEGWNNPALPFSEDILRLFDYYSLYKLTGKMSKWDFPDISVTAEFAQILALMPEYFGKACFRSK